VPTTDRPQPRTAGLAAFLSLLFPGLGQAYAGAPRWAVLFATPVLLLLLAPAGITLLSADRLGNDLLSATFLSAALVVNLALLAWRLAAILHAALAARPSFLGRGARHRALTIGLIVVLLATTIGMHAWAGALIGRLSATLEDVFAGEAPGGSGVPMGRDRTDQLPAARHRLRGRPRRGVDRHDPGRER
jgi:TM2 domain-containing membrane protein YozV